MNTFNFIRRDWSAKFFVAVTVVALVLGTFPVAFFVAQADQPDTVNICKANQSLGSFVLGVKSVSENAIKVGLANSGINGDIVENGQNWDFIYPNGFTGAEIFAADCSATIKGSISGTKYNDADNDSSISGDDGIENWEIRLYEVDAPWVLVDTKITDSYGEYEFLDLPEGQYKVCEVMKDNWTQTFVSNGSANASPNVSEEGPLCRTVNIDKLVDDNTVNFGNHYTTPVDYCDPSQRPDGMSIAAWHDANDFDGASCFDYEVTQQCGSLDVQFTKNETDYDYLFYYAIGSLTPELANWEGDGPLPVNFAEDEYGGSVDVTYYATGPEKDFITGSDIPNIWDVNGETVTINTDCEAEQCEPERYVYADNVEDNEQGLTKNGDAVGANRSNSNNVIGEPDGVFYSLGFEGWIIVSFDRYVLNVDGDDLSVHEVTNGTYPLENATVEVSQDGSVWYSLTEEARNDNDEGGYGVTLFDFDETGLDWIKYVRITDITDSLLHANNADGFDLDAVDATYVVCDEPEPEPVDVCSNLDGVQTELPDGYEFVDEGVCELIPVDDDDDDSSDGDEDEDEDGGNSSTATRTGHRRVGPTPTVAGISTTGQCPFLTDYMQIGMDNDPWEVTKLQMFLTIVMGLETPVTGVFDVITDQNVKIFQERYRGEVLDPWYIRGIVPHNEATGFVYKTTLWKINSIVCPDYAVLPVFEGEDLYSNVDID